ncbi:hypothetical protein [Actinomadura sp. 9N407]|uniref:hypothetical protein n=1 Tax=Actinomadura sp. 9N407 TaxID=3375154 RepID=UPI0037997912
MGDHRSTTGTTSYTYDDDHLPEYSDERIRELYNHYQEQGTLGDHPRLQHQHNIVTMGEETPKVGDYQGNTRTSDPSTKWGKEAKDGYEVDPEELRNLRTTILNELDDLKGKLDAVKGLKGFTEEKVGGGSIGNTWVGMATKASTVFGENYGHIVASIEGVAAKLKASADAYENAHDSTKKSTENVQA